MAREKPALDRDALFEFALRRLASRAMSRAELLMRLKARAADASDPAAVIARLEDCGVLDDRKFAESYAANRANNQGKLRVLRDLRVRSVNPQVAHEAVEKAFEGTDELRLAAKFLERKYRPDTLRELVTKPKGLVGVYRKLRLAGFTHSASTAVLQQYTREVAVLEDADESEMGEPIDR